MTRPVLIVAAAAVLSIAVLAGSAGVAAADGGVAGPGLPTPRVTLPPLPVPTPPTVPVPTLPGTVPAAPVGPIAAPSDGSRPGAPRGGASASGSRKPGSSVRPVLAGTAAAQNALDDESSPALNRASRSYLDADTKIAALTQSRAAMNAARDAAGQAAASCLALQIDAADARAYAAPLQTRSDRLNRAVTAAAVRAYQTDETNDEGNRDLFAAAAQAEAAATRAQMDVASIVGEQDRATLEVIRFTGVYTTAQRDLGDVDQRLLSLANQRAAALADAQRAKAGDLDRHRQTLAESGQLGAMIRAASARLAATGRTVAGTGTFVRPSSGVVTSPYGMRMHPILHYVKLHTGTDFAVGDGYARAVDSGRVLFTIVSPAYGNFTVIDHGIIDGRHITTAYAHQARFLVKPGDVIAKGQRIGIIGSTGYATGPHLHLEVRDNGAVEDPMPWLPR